MSKEYMKGYNLGYDDGKKVGLLEAYRNIELAEQCLNYLGFYCKSRECRNKYCPLHYQLKETIKELEGKKVKEAVL